MRVAILGAGFTGLAAALELLRTGHKVTVLEREETVGGLAMGFKQPGWEWSLEKAYHHWFTTDSYILNLARQLNYPVVIKKPRTNVFINNQSLPFDSPLSILTFPYLPLTDRIKTGLAALYMKMVSNYQSLEGQKALPWVRKHMGSQASKLIWEPLFTGKFGAFKEEIALTWFWSRIKKRTFALAYPEGGFQNFALRVAEEIKKLGGEIRLNCEVSEIIPQTKGWTVIARTSSSSSSLSLGVEDLSLRAEGLSLSKRTKQSFNRDRHASLAMTIPADKVIVTLPSPIFTKIAPGLPADYVKRISSIPHLSALNLILVLKQPFMPGTYWLNITDQKFPFLVLAEHTNFMDPQHYGGQHLLYIGNYLPPDHPYLQMSAQELLRVFDPFLKKINPNYQLSIINSQLFSAPFAQPVVTVDYPKLIPQLKTPLPNVYLANMDMVYPWDRQTNYAMEMGQKVAELAVSS